MVLNEKYGFNVLALRNRAMQHIYNSIDYGLQTRTIVEFYGDAKIDWDVLMLTGKNIVQAKSIN